ncbi:hypothetical protein COT98_03930 [Candidatus Falkowbacteria bacterium CG10_big_fil_rev_8_21_14_0_10_39_9]|uniref:DUF5723 domain-containing protein n=1 Tax=Candidatus Falkowbacteria bacterium CG10_big_fil_rev_8_21_14_0_10_39_9 TaxID=1974566 RepID=A0A2M6WNR5_9BACT|nr:MAG: hypothetical protein COT98_03930 [Candidatus Falkowbacteria bacterium CG10_big_fil_rev_8_21_14_0_10_39_9]
MKKIVSIILLCHLSFWTFGQFTVGDVPTKFYANSPGLLSPALAAYESLGSLTLEGYSSFNGFRKNPKSAKITAGGFLKNEKLGFYSNVLKYSVQNTSGTDFSLSTIYRSPLNTKGDKFSLALSFLVFNQKFDPSQVTVVDPNDPVLLNNSNNWLNYEAGFSAAIYRPNNYFVAVRAENLIGTKMNYGNDNFNNVKPRLYGLTLAKFFKSSDFDFGLIVAGSSDIKKFSGEATASLLYKKIIGLNLMANANNIGLGLVFNAGSGFSLGAYSQVLGIGGLSCPASNGFFLQKTFSEVRRSL